MKIYTYFQNQKYKNFQVLDFKRTNVSKQLLSGEPACKHSLGAFKNYKGKYDNSV